jgi:GTPase involved in cell partitioning and DNA repair
MKMKKQDLIKKKKAEEKAMKLLEIKAVTDEINEFKKKFKEDIFWSAINRMKEKIRIEKQANKEIAEAQKKLDDAKRRYGK